MSWVTFRLRDQSNRCISFGPHFSTHSGSVSCLLLILTPSPSLSVLLSLFTFPTLRYAHSTRVADGTRRTSEGVRRVEKTRGGWMACDRRLTTLRYGRDHYVSRLPRHTPRLSSLASVAHPSLHPLVPEARRRRGEGTRGGGRKGRRDGPLHITYSTRSAGRVRPFPHLSSLRFPTVPSLREVRRTRVVNVENGEWPTHERRRRDNRGNRLDDKQRQETDILP